MGDTREHHLMQLVLLAGLVVLGAGCGRQEPLRINQRLTSLRMAAKSPPDATYVVDPPDVLQIEWVNVPEQSRTATVRQDGTITLPLVEEVEVAGLTPLEIGDKLRELYSEFYREPQILVTVAQYASKHIFVYGEVGGQGAIPYTGYQTVADVIGQVGGFSRRAAIKRIKVVRGDVDDPEIFRVNLSKLLHEGETLQNVSLAENDVVYVPPTHLAWVGYQIDAVLFPFRSLFAFAGTVEAADDITNGGDDDDD